MFFACGLVLLIFILPALAISWVIPAEELSLTAGVMQAFEAFFAYFNLQMLVPIVAIALVCASAGGMLTWLAGPSKGLLLIARREGYLPPFFQQQNENEFPVHILVVQGAVTTVIALLYALVPSVSSAYWILSVMTTQVYLIVYLLMFVAAVKLRRTQPDVERGYTAPALTFMCVVGLPRLGGGDPDRVRAAVAVRERQRRGVRRADPGRHRAARPAPAGAVPLAAQAQLEDGRRPRRRRHERYRLLYWVIGGVLIVLCIIGLVTYSEEKETQQAQAKAQELTQKLEAAGLRTPEDPKVFVRTLGDDGGVVCDNPTKSYGKALLYDQLTNGADFVGRRPVIVDRDILRGVALILDTYCPDQLEHYQDAIDDLKTDDTTDL